MQSISGFVMHHKRRWLIVASKEDNDNCIYHSNRLQFNNLKKIQDGFVNKLKKARRTLADQQTKLKEMRQSKVRGEQSIETKVFRVLKEIGVKLSSYNGGSLNGKDIKKVMNNAYHIFEQFAEIFKEGKRNECLLSDADIDLMCLHF